MLMQRKVGPTRRTLVKLLGNLQKENQFPMWRELFSHFYSGVSSSEDEEEWFARKEEPDVSRVRGKISVLKKYLKQLEKLADSGEVNRFRCLRVRLRGERAFALQLIRCGEEHLKERKGTKEGR